MARKVVVPRTFLDNDGNVVEVDHGSSATSHGLPASMPALSHRGRRHWSLLVALWMAGRTRRKADTQPGPNRRSEVKQQCGLRLARRSGSAGPFWFKEC